MSLFLGLGLCYVAAPMLPPPELTRELLVGRWDFRWGGMPNGWVELRADGTYYSRHNDAAGGPEYAGRWTVKGGALVLSEGRMPCPGEGGALRMYWDYTIPLSTAGWPTLTGKWGSAVVVLSNPVRE